ncbi:hypothetical protein Y032_0081g1451 [Ancylostoma ceylanicum]|uniref:Uncharacterized protein n=1 Tax=Ancylostoma ceylanicum TaxID=53326 RepID=A0A016TS42_9BILA|nr:hypothetical protein Y032_0081g1451 [Ancylostoma ceylanicum]
MLVPSILFLVAVAYANEDEETTATPDVILLEVPDYTPDLGRASRLAIKRAAIPFSGGMYGKRAAMPFSGGMYGKRGPILPFSGGVYGKRSEAPEDVYEEERQPLPLSAGWFEKRAVMPFSGGVYGKRAPVLPFSGGVYGKRTAMPFSGGLYGKRSSDRYIRSPMPISGGFFG